MIGLMVLYVQYTFLISCEHGFGKYSENSALLQGLSDLAGMLNTIKPRK
jgi:hypothetical protein